MINSLSNNNSTFYDVNLSNCSNNIYKQCKAQIKLLQQTHCDLEIIKEQIINIIKQAEESIHPNFGISGLSPGDSCKINLLWECFFVGQDKCITLNQIKPYVDALDLQGKTNSYTISLAIYLCGLSKNNSLDSQDDFIRMVYRFLELKYSNFNCKLYQVLVRHLEKENPPPYAIDKLLDKYYGDDFFNGKYDEQTSICKNKIDTFILKMKNIDKIMVFVIDTIKHTEEQLDLRSEFSNMTPADFCKVELL